MLFIEPVVSVRRRTRDQGARRALSIRARTALAALAAILLPQLVAAPSARAETPKQVLVIPLESSVPDAQADVALAFNLALAELAKREGASVTVAQTSLDDTMAIVGCSERTAACLGRVARALEVDRIVFGSVTPDRGADRFSVVLVVAGRENDAPPVEHRFSVRAGAVTEAEHAFTEAAPDDLLDARPLPASDPAGGAAGDGGDGGAAGGSGVDGRGESEAPGVRYRFESDRVERSSWIVTGAGGALFGVGTLFWMLARSSQADVDALEVRSSGDIERLLALEDRTRARANVGNALVVTGVLTAATGAVLALRQGLVREEPADVTIAPMATGDAVGLTLVFGWSP